MSFSIKTLSDSYLKFDELRQNGQLDDARIQAVHICSRFLKDAIHHMVDLECNIRPQDDILYRGLISIKMKLPDDDKLISVIDRILRDYREAKDSL